MFGLGMMEILMILAIALIVVGPQKLPELAKTLGKAMGEFKRSAADLKRSMDIETTVKDIEVPKTDLKEILDEPDESPSKEKEELQTEPYVAGSENLTDPPAGDDEPENTEDSKNKSPE